MNRDSMVAALREGGRPWDMVVVGGGATGLGTAVDAASRGYRTLLLEQGDFAQGTSSRSTKLVHGGVRYLRQGNVSLVIDALRERGYLLRNAPHLVHNLPFVVPNYVWWEGPFYGIGLKMYDLLAGKQGIGRSKVLSKEKTLELLPTIEPEGLTGGVVYYDGQFDDARLAVNLAQTAAQQGAVLVNYCEVTGLLKSEDGEVRGVRVADRESGDEHEVEARVVINATGPFADGLRRMDEPGAGAMIAPSQGVHIVLEKDFLPGGHAIMVPKTDDGRVLFAIPWLDKVVVGTTETPVDEVPLEPRPFPEEIEFLLEHAARYLTHDPGPDDVLSTWAGLRPLVGGDEADTASLSRDHTLVISGSGLVTVTGGKWTTYRKMAEDTVDQAAIVAGVQERPCVTRDLQVYGYHPNAERFGALAGYGAAASDVEELSRARPELGEALHPRRPTLAAEVVWAVRREMARTVEDFLSRRTRTLLLDARAAVEMAPRVAELMAAELGRGDDWQREQVRAFGELARGYLVEGGAPLPAAEGGAP